MSENSNGNNKNGKISKKTILILFFIILSVLTGIYFKTRESLPFKYKYAPELIIARYCLADKDSKVVFDSAVKFLSSHDVSSPHVISDLPELEHKYVYVHKGDYILDGGISGDATVSEYLLNKTGKNGKVFGIEPNPYLKDKINSLLTQKYPEFTLYQYALWNENGVGEFDLGLKPDDDINLQGHIAEIYQDPKSPNIVKVDLITVDNLIKDNNIRKIDYIKLDIEGAELPALSGSAQTIKKYKPDLVISCHHEYDFFKIALLIHNTNNEYKIYLSEHPANTNKYWRNYIIYATVRNANTPVRNPWFPEK